MTEPRRAATPRLSRDIIEKYLADIDNYGIKGEQWFLDKEYLRELCNLALSSIVFGMRSESRDTNDSLDGRAAPQEAPAGAAQETAKAPAGAAPSAQSADESPMTVQGLHFKFHPSAPSAARRMTDDEPDDVKLARRVVKDYAEANAGSRILRPGRTVELDLAEAVIEHYERAERAIDSEMDKLIAMPDERIEAALRLEGRDPKDAAIIASQAAKIAMLTVDLAEARRTASSEQTRSYWLIERGSPAEWWGGSEVGWTRDASKVHPLLRFDAKEKAEGEADRIKYFPLVVGSELRVTEHLDCAGPDLTAPRSEERVAYDGKPVTIIADHVERIARKAEAAGAHTEARELREAAGALRTVVRSAIEAPIPMGAVIDLCIQYGADHNLVRALREMGETENIETHALMLELCHQLGAQDGESMVEMLLAAVKDALRYRHLRTHWSDFTGNDSSNPGPWLDGATDAAIFRRADRTGEPK